MISYIVSPIICAELLSESYIAEVGKIRKELGELQNIYEDYKHLTDRIIEVLPKLDADRKKIGFSVLSAVQKSLEIVTNAEDELRLITENPNRFER